MLGKFFLITHLYPHRPFAPLSGTGQTRQIGKQQSVKTICKCRWDFGREADWDLFLLICKSSLQNCSPQEAWGWLGIFRGSISGKCRLDHTAEDIPQVSLISDVTSAGRSYLPGALPWIIFLYLCISEIHHLSLLYLTSLSWDVSFMRVETSFVFSRLYRSRESGICGMLYKYLLIDWLHYWMNEKLN